MNRIIFLDFDGPLTNVRTYLAYDKPLRREMWTTADPVALKLIENLCYTYDARVVISSTWRQTTLTPTKLNPIESLDSWGFGQDSDLIYNRDDPHSCYTPCLWNSNTSRRSSEILKWIETHKPTHWCAIDDLPLDSKCHDVVVDPYDGMSYKDYEMCCKMLDKLP